MQDKGFQEIKEDFYKRYLKLKLELDTLEQEIEVFKQKYDKELYSGMKDVSGVDYSKIVLPKQSKDINEFYQNFINLGKEIREKENYRNILKNVIEKIEIDFKKYAQNFNDLEMKLFIELYIYKKPISQIILLKSNDERYSYRQLTRIHKNLRKKMKNY